MPQILPLLNENGIVLTQEPSFVSAGDSVVPTLVSRLTHVASGDVQQSEMPLLLDKENSQGLGSAITYGRRYAVLAMLGLVADVDDDGNSASAPAPRAQRAAASSGEPSAKQKVTALAKEKLGKEKPSPAEVAKLFGVKVGDLSKEDVLQRILAENA